MKIDANAILSSPLCKRLSISTDMRAFVVGDLDGDLQRLKKSLESVSYNSNDDLLICLGDLIDRGSESIELINFLEEKKH